MYVCELDETLKIPIQLTRKIDFYEFLLKKDLLMD